MKISKLWILILALVIVIIYLVQCRGTKIVTVEKPVTVPVEQLKDNVKKDEDTASIIIAAYAETNKLLIVENNKLENKLDDANQDVRLLEQQNEYLANQLAASELTDSIKATNTALSLATRKADSICKASIGNLKNQVTNRNNIISTERNKYNKLKLNFDTCIDNQKKLDEYSNKLAAKLKPKIQLILSAEAFGYSGSILNGYGAGVGLRFKNGTMALIKALQINGNQNYGAQIIVPISFRK